MGDGDWGEKEKVGVGVGGQEGGGVLESTFYPPELDQTGSRYSCLPSIPLRLPAEVEWSGSGR